MPGVPVGVITKLEGTSSSLTKEALVRPFADDTALGVVGVVVVPPRTDPRFSVLPPRPTPSPTASATASPGRHGASSGATASPGPGARPHPAPPDRGADVRRAALAAALLLLAILIQVTLINNLPWPGAAGPDLVLVAVVALALTGGPLEGMLGGFCAGLALDVAPPATHLIGQYALVFCLVGYGCGRVGGHLSESVWAPIGVVAIGSAAGELLFALTGMIFGDLNVTWSAVGHVLPASVLYDVLLSPFVLYAVIRARALAAPALDAQGLASFPGGSASQRVVPGLAGAAALFAGSGAVLRDSGTGRAPRLKARTLRAGSNQGGSASGTRPAKRPPARPVHVNFSSAAGGSAAGARPAKRAPSRPVNLHLGSRGNRISRDPAARQLAARWRDAREGLQPGEPVRVTRPQGSWQRGGGMPAKAFSRSRTPSAGPAPWAMAGAARPCARRRGVPGSAAASCRVGRRAAPGPLACDSMLARRGRCSCGWDLAGAATARSGARSSAAAAGAAARVPGRCTPPGSGGPRRVRWPGAGHRPAR